MAFGLTNAPATFQRLMERCMGELNLKECLIYLDDVIIFSDTVEKHFERLAAVFSRLEHYGLKLKGSKCEFFQLEVKYLGHVVSADGVRTDPEKTSVLKDWPIPKSIKDLRSFLGFAGYYRRFVNGFSQITKPLNDLLVGHSTNKKAKSTKLAAPCNWGPSQQEAFETIIRKLTSAPTLTYADYSKPFILNIDASCVGLGAVLYQEVEGKKKVVAYASRGLRPSERNYLAHKLEFLSLKWAVYRFGKQNVDADILSRLPESVQIDSGVNRIMYPDVLKALFQATLADVHELPAFECVSISQQVLDTPSSEEVDIGSNLSDINWLTEQYHFVDRRIRECQRCIRRKTTVRTATPLVSVESTFPLEFVCMDYLSLEMSSGGYEHILVITDHFTRYAQAIPTRNQTAHTTAKILFEQFICHYGFPSRLHSDQGRNFESAVILELCKLANIEKSRTTPYHPQGNGMAERFNQTLLNMLGTLEDSQKSNWKAHVPPLVHANNSTRHESTGLTPHFLMFGRHPRLAIDAFLGIEPEDSEKFRNHSNYVMGLQKRLSYAYKVASRESKRQSRRHKRRYDLRVRHAKIEPGDRVLVRNVGLKGIDSDVNTLIRKHLDIIIYKKNAQLKKLEERNKHKAKDVDENIKRLNKTYAYLSARIDCNGKSRHSFEKSCFYVGNDVLLTWIQANEKCQQLNATLAEVETKEENV
ncbi:uncharacterized protein LOC132759951 [Ruditapes philippinarum]|uniref:uncharacterized protein LOC132759951 n=1 Tax=Ruditapes philippinarum TaxID=129788 RepID=UPI00295B93E5|nr:uncharacterized protein LOC132759951 [Ruditapes philippinarum]